MRMTPSLTFDDARTIADACIEAARAENAAVSIAVADNGGHLLHFIRLDGARLHTVDLACGKARIAAQVGIATAVIEGSYAQRGVQPPPGFPGAGGVPMAHEGQCAGAVGISGATGEMDERIAQSGLSALKSLPVCAESR